MALRGSQISAEEALKRLVDGNRHFAADARASEALLNRARRAELARTQEPFATVLGCSDSRVPAEIVFDQGLGDLFVIRVAGNIVAPSQIGSVEFAAARFGTPLVVVLGHSRVRPAIESLLDTDVARDEEALVRRAVRANIRASVDHLRHGSQILEQMIQEDRLRVVGAEYSLETGVVDFFL